MKLSTSITCLALSFSALSFSYGEPPTILSEEEAKLPAISLLRPTKTSFSHINSSFIHVTEIQA